MSNNLLQGETIIIVARQHWLNLVARIIGISLVAVAITIAFSFFPGSVMSYEVGRYKILAILLIWLVALAMIAGKYLRWRSVSYTLTDKRVIVMNGLFSRFAESIPLDRIQNTLISQSFFARLIGFGNVEIDSAGRDGTEILYKVAQPQRFENAIMSATERHSSMGRNRDL